MGVKKKFMSKKTNPNVGSQSISKEINDGMHATATDASQPETVEEAVTQNETEVPDTGQDEKDQKPDKPRRGLIGIIADRLGYVKINKVTQWTTDIYKSIAEGMDENGFAALQLKEKFEALADGISNLMQAHARELEQANAAVTEANGLVEAEIRAKVEALAEAEQAKNHAIHAENRANEAELKVKALESEKQLLQNGIDKMNAAKGEQEKRDETVQGDIKELRTENGKLCGQIDTLERELGTANNSNAQLTEINNELNRRYNTLQSEHIKLQSKHDTLQGEYKSLQETYNICNARREELEASEVGQLTETIKAKDKEITGLNADKTAAEEAKKQIEADKSLVDQQLEEVRSTLQTRDGELNAERETTKGLRLRVKAHETEIDALTNQNSKFAKTIESQNAELETRQTTINEKKEEIGRLNSDNVSLRGEITTLNEKVRGLEQDKATLTTDNESIKHQLDEKADFIRAERDGFAQEMMSLAKNLSEAAAKDFLGCCDDAFEGNRISLQEKVLKPIRALERKMKEVNPGSYASRDELAAAYHSLIKSQFDEASGLTRIAQWYAYSQVAFMVDKDRSDGLFIRQREIRDIYGQAVKLMGNVGIEYCLPALYAERLSEDSPYDDVTGRRQLNIEYMCPTARSHKENIDCIDSSQVIIDVVEVGFTDSKGNNKKSQVII